MTPQRARELESELRRLADRIRRHAVYPGDIERARAYTHAADLVRDAAGEVER